MCSVNIPYLRHLAKPSGAAGGGREGGLGAVGGEGITGIKGLASRELTYRLSFMACSVQVPPSALHPHPHASQDCAPCKKACLAETLAMRICAVST